VLRVSHAFWLLTHFFSSWNLKRIGCFYYLKWKELESRSSSVLALIELSMSMALCGTKKLFISEHCGFMKNTAFIEIKAH